MDGEPKHSTRMTQQEMDEEVVPPGGVGARHVEQAFTVMPLKQALESAERDRRLVLAYVLRRYIREVERSHMRRERQIVARQRELGLLERVDSLQPSDEPADEPADEQEGR